MAHANNILLELLKLAYCNLIGCRQLILSDTTTDCKVNTFSCRHIPVWYVIVT